MTLPTPGITPSADAWPLTCPLCDAPLNRTTSAFVCAQAHSFDIAREGYVNLLAPRSRGIFGDSASMLKARRAFLDAGHYDPLRDLLAGEVLRSLRQSGEGPDAGRAAVLDAGCGEGWYLGGIGGTLVRDLDAGDAPPLTLLGMDVSKDAARLAAKRHPQVTVFVGDVTRRIHVRDGSITVLLDIFAPRNPDEFHRILAPGGALIVVIPRHAHLLGLRETFGLIDIQTDKEAVVRDKLATGFTLADRRELRHPLTLSPEDIRNVIAMGPSSHHRAAGSAIPPGEGPFETEAAFLVLRFIRR